MDVNSNIAVFRRVTVPIFFCYHTMYYICWRFFSKIEQRQIESVSSILRSSKTPDSVKLLLRGVTFMGIVDIDIVFPVLLEL